MRLLIQAFLCLVVMCPISSSFAVDNPQGEAIGGKGKDKDKSACEQEAKDNASTNASKQCSDYCKGNGKSMCEFKLKENSGTATCVQIGRNYEGTGSVVVETCKCCAMLAEPTCAEDPLSEFANFIFD